MAEATPEPGTRLPDIDSIALLDLIPHRYPMLLVDRITEVVAFESAVGIKNVTHNEPFFPGHFPGDPIMPGVLIIESLAQAAAALVVASRNRKGQRDGVYFMAVDEARFRRPVRPGSQLRLEVKLIKHKMGVWRFSGRALVDGELATQTTFAAKVLEGAG